MNLPQFQLSAQQLLDYERLLSGGLSNIQIEMNIRGDYPTEQILATLALVTDRHDLLRTAFVFREGIHIPFQIVAAAAGIGNDCFSTTTLTLEHPLSIAVVQRDTGVHTIILKALPLILDTYSANEIRKEVIAILQADTTLSDAADILQFGNYTEWEAQVIEEGNPEALAFWTELREKVSATVPVPAASVEPAARIAFSFNAAKIEALSVLLKVSPQAILIAVFGQSLSRYTDHAPFTIGCLEHGRYYEELSAVLGPLSRYYPFLVPENIADDVQQLAVLVGQRLEEARNWNDYYYVSLAQKDFRFLFEFDDTDALIFNEGTTAALKLRISRTNDAWKATLVFPGSSSYREMATFLSEDLKCRLEETLTPRYYVNTFDQAFIGEYNNTVDDTLSLSTIPEAILTVFQEREHAIAVQSEKKRMTYGMLSGRVKQVATALIQQIGVQRGDLVGIMMDNSVETPVALLGILFSGAGYVPLDRNNPPGRLQGIIEESGCKCIITDAAAMVALRELPASKLGVTLDQLEQAGASGSLQQEFICARPEDTAYLIFTSGTTGKPKGCHLLHKHLSNYIHWANGYYFRGGEEGNFPLLTNLSFDLTITSIFTTLSRGHTLFCPDSELSLIEQLQYCFSPANAINAIKLTPTHISLLADVEVSHSNIQCAIVGGEELLPSQVATLRRIAPGIKIYNEYGPTEATVGCIVKEIAPDEQLILIGRPIANMEVLVLNERQELLPVGVSGELYIAGRGVAQGYWKQEQLTAEKFVTLDFFGPKRYYRTGDLGCLLPDGNMKYQGRMDDQVKIRGNRIELGEIQVQLAKYEGIGQVIVVVKQDQAAEKHIAAYYTASETFPADVLKQYLHTRLPEYMIPGFFIPVKEIPLTANGKLDPGKLPDPFLYHSKNQTVYIAPTTLVEIGIAQIWQEVFHISKVGIDDNFFDMGGHSLLAMRLISGIRKEMNADLAVKDLFTSPTIRDLSALVQGRTAQPLLPQVVRKERSAHIPLSFSQERLWFIDRLMGSAHYHMPSVFRLEGHLNVNLLEDCFRQIINRHEPLRTVFKEEEGIPYQEVLALDGWHINYIDASLAEEELEPFITAEVTRPFHLSCDHMLRVTLLKITEQEHLLILVMHHIAADGWSEALIVQEFLSLYSGKQELPLLDFQYADYAIWQRRHMSGDILAQQLDYWKETLTELTPLHLPTDFTRPPIQSTKGARLSFIVDSQVSRQLQELAAEEGVTLFMLLLSVYKVLLYQYSRQTDICVGTTIAHRPQQEMEAMIGFFVNAVALRSDLDGNPAFTDLLAQVKRNTLAAYDHIAVPFEKVVDAVEKDRDKSRSSLFQVLFVLNNNEDASVHSLGDLRVIPVLLQHEIAKFDLTFFARETAEGIAITINYCSDLFLPQTIERMKGHYETLLSAVVRDRGQQIMSLQLLRSGEQEELLSPVMPVPHEYAGNRTVISLFEDQVVRTPAATALVYGKQQWSYQALNEQADRLACHLRNNYQLGLNDLAGIMMDTADWYLVSILGILKTGAAYVPIDISLPPDRRNFIIQDTGVKVLIILSEHLFEVMDVNAPVFSIDLQLEEAVSGITDGPGATMSDLAYVIYTSGTTGQPKGVKITNRNITDYYFGLEAHIGVAENRSFALMSALSADLGNTVLFGSLLSGGELHLLPKAYLMNADVLHDYFEKHTIDCIKIVPSHWSALESDRGLLLPARTIIFGGEALSPAVVEKIRRAAPALQIINHYGPTETTIGKLLHRIDSSRSYDSVPIGKPFSHTTTYIVNGSMGLCPVGVPGELLIGGDGISPGYLHREALTAESFISNPFGQGRLYRTGDLVRRNEAGEIFFLGRIDDQVKIRGYRVEPGEVAVVLSASELVRQCTVVVQEERLAAYIVPEGAYDKDGIVKYLQSALPDYMIPSLMMELAEMPLTPNGKINRKALPDIAGATDRSTTYTAPRNQIEEELVVIWESLLEKDTIGVYDNFFDLGGHSLLAIRVLSAIRKKLGMEIAITDLFEYVTIASLADFIGKQGQRTLLPPLIRQERPARIPLSYAQERLWFIDQLRGSTHYHMPSMFRLNGALDKPLLESAFREIVNRHESLRTVFKEEEGIGYQEILDKDGWKLDVGTATEDELPALIEQEIARPFNLSTDHMIRARLLQLGLDDYLLVLVRHHIASDGWSVSLIVNELTELYCAGKEKRVSQLPVLPLQYADYTLWQRAYLSGELLDAQLSFWKEQLQELAPLHLPLDFPRPVLQSTKGADHSFMIAKGLSEQLQLLAQQQGVSMFMLLLSVYKILLYRYSGQTDICVGTTVAHRPQQEIEPLIGFFVNTLALRTDLAGDPSFTDLLARVKNTTLSAYEHITVPFEKVVDAVENVRDKSRSSIFQALFVLNNNEDISIHSLGDVSIQPLPQHNVIAKFDLTFFVQETALGIAVTINYCRDLFLPATIARMQSHYEMLLQGVVNNHMQAIHALNILDPAEEQLLLQEQVLPWMEKAAACNILTLFEEQVEKTPDATAVVFGNITLSYSELDEKANCLGRYLKQTYDLSAGDRVGILMETSSWYIVSILGILKAGAAYVPVDGGLPQDRKAFIVNDTGMKTLIIVSESLFDVMDLSVPVFSIDIQFEETTTVAGGLEQPGGEDLAYVIYTSGTTGQPKGVKITHRNIVDYYFGLQARTGIDENRSFALMSALSADLGNTVLFGALLSGSVLHLLPKTSLMNAAVVHDYFARHSIDCIKLVPSYWSALESERGLLLPARTIIFGGEALSSGVIEKIKAIHPALQIINHYGPTEATIGKLLHRIDPSRTYDSVPIGQPFSHTTAYIVNGFMRLCPIGVPGELLLGGDGISPGYLNREDLTAEKFISNPFGQGRLYRTGDLVRRNAEGEIFFLGRIDDQVKIRGYRVEPGEVAVVLSASDLVRQCAVVFREDRLVAYVVPEGTFDKEGIVKYLQSVLPDYMIPSLMMELEEMPLTPNGKIDRKALPDIAGDTVRGKTYLAPRNKVEEELVTIWESLLKADKIGVNDNFFELGGDSIIVIQVVSKAKRKGYQLQVQDLFDHQTITALALLIEQNNTATVVAEQGLLTGSALLSPIQQWFFEQEQPNPSHFNQAVLLQVNKAIRQEDLGRAIKVLVDRHDALRFYYDGKEQTYGPTKGKLEIMELSQLEEITTACRVVQREFSITAGALIRFILFRTPHTEPSDRLFIVAHHLVVDGVSWRILIDEMQSLLDAYSATEELDLGLKTSSYREWVNALTDYAQTEQVLTQKDYWQKVSNSHQPLSSALNGHLSRRSELVAIDMRLSPEYTARLLKETNFAYNTDINDILLCALGMTISSWRKNPQVIIGLEGHGRENIFPGIDITNTVGWFTNKYPVLLEIADDDSIGNTIKSVKEQLRNIPDKGMGFGALRYLHPEPAIRHSLRSNCWDIVFNYLGQMDNVINAGSWFEAATEPSGEHIDPDYFTREKFVLKAGIAADVFSLSWSYSPEQFQGETVTRLVREYMHHLRELIDHCTTQKEKAVTPADFGLNGKLDYKELDELLGLDQVADDEGIIKF
ncbi:non-ribosomal peptide synthetase [Chitinophaga sancti]|uniref:AMP-binding enzyme C-terminal domain-containing protein n=1 Tax=Chitinophaga sancti TaxID=1004 RepID=A0A1K1QP09_9BACT|nr:non-ribosomal peptide synthetase [Chitinophaga sancti]WQD65076.1 non-ribosomal peptide synthetase [Chitinophaga sancti]WQG89300.1 non-ribosomal peptide synthetase [Chitinophaga sancti]SFW61371.1 AMP-binding enzyme C-terminal domain-containing protein [Chitinophaga sancti]